MKATAFQVPKRIEHEGAPLVYMSPTKPARNLGLIYEAIKDLPDSTVLQADHDANGRPYVFFPGESKTSKRKDPVKQQNLSYYRHELGHILETSVAAAKKNEGKSALKTNTVAAGMLQKLATFTPGHSDFTAGQLKPVLKKIVAVNKTVPADTPVIKPTALASNVNPLAPAIPLKKASKQKLAAAKPAHESPKKSGFYYDKKSMEKLRMQRLNFFTLLSKKDYLLIKAALFGDRSTVTVREQDQAINAMKKLVTDYIEQPDFPTKSLQQFVKESDAKKDLECFARHWGAAIKAGKRKSSANTIQLLQITIFNWTPEINAISEDITKNMHRHQRAISGRLEKFSTHYEKIEVQEEESSLVESTSEDDASINKKDSSENAAKQATLQAPSFKKLEADEEENALFNLLSNPTIEELERSKEETLVQRAALSSVRTNSTSVVAAERVMLSEFLYRQPLRQSQWSMPVIQGLEDYLSTSASQPDMTDADRRATDVLADLLTSFRQNFQELQIYQASSPGVASVSLQPEQDSDASPLLSEITSDHQENFNQ